MVDVDHFKLVNDNHGHSMGDKVLRRVAKTIREAVRDADIVCRYGGEEFCVLLPQETDVACQTAERIRCAIAELEFETFSLTASLGVSTIVLDAAEPQELLDQADKCLYLAKRSGRNRVVRWDELPTDVEIEESQDRAAADCSRDAESDALIPYPAVASLLSALAYRDADTAAHSTRVAELSVATARGLMSLKEAYVLEIGALLHDIGKIGVPDAILLKPGPLTHEEWETMENHDRIGVEIVNASFSNQHLVDILRYHHATYGGSPDAPQMPKGKDIPLGARIVTIVDAYDAMVSDRVYRKGRNPEKAFEELRRCAGRQFDPELVERFIAVAKDYKSIELPVGSKQTAVQIGLQIERLAQAVDDQDDKQIKALAARLETTAARARIPEIEAVAAEIKDVADDDQELVSLLEMVNQLIDLCRSTQRIYVEVEPKKQSALKHERELCLASQASVNEPSPVRPSDHAIAD
jgi:diguanylate cyclase (GGDEF)-like protein/putative nucleotidyltransferase with HDIG domain